jgi:hypothetical protein
VAGRRNSEFRVTLLIFRRPSIRPFDGSALGAILSSSFFALFIFSRQHIFNFATQMAITKS